ncbi:MAG: DNA-binding transcriptional regulator [Sedimentisphaerales bacterium]|nr:DNA-binding transcriptional regulator [Sedimentisphaerales bacterium]
MSANNSPAGSYAGRGLRKTLTVLVFVETSREFGRGLLYGIAKYSRLHAHWRIYQRPVALDSSLPDWQDMKIDGAIARDVQVAQGLVHADFPVIFVQHSREIYERFPSLLTDAQSIATMGAEHLLERGFRYFAFCGYDEFIWSRNRAVAFKERISREGLEVFVYTQPGSRTKRLWKNEQYILADWLTSLPKPIALMACNDDRALQVVEACKLAGIAVPEDVAVIGVDNDPLVCELADPPISSIALSTEAAGYATAELLDRLMHGEPMSGQRIMVYPTHVVARVSTDITAVTDPEVAAAVCYIREHADRPIQVMDVVRATAVSRRVLENKFRTALRRSIHQEIQRVRVNHIMQLLVDTDLAIKEIARRAGFDSPGHIARYFRRVTGVSLREYRHRFTAR